LGLKEPSLSILFRYILRRFCWVNGETSVVGITSTKTRPGMPGGRARHATN
jgi:hypothetical protein